MIEKAIGLFVKSISKVAQNIELDKQIELEIITTPTIDTQKQSNMQILQFKMRYKNRTDRTHTIDRVLFENAKYPYQTDAYRKTNSSSKPLDKFDGYKVFGFEIVEFDVVIYLPKNADAILHDSNHIVSYAPIHNKPFKTQIFLSNAANIFSKFSNRQFGGNDAQ